MNIQKLNDCMEILKKDLGEGLVASSIVSTADAQTLIATEHSKPGAATMFSELTNSIQEALSQGYPPLGKFYYLDLAGNKGILFLPFGDYQWGIAIDTQKAKLGLLLNVILPKIVNAFEDAIVS
ncbi:MAG: hypothetical protein ACE14T_03355 [Syntrophales bacterium]